MITAKCILSKTFINEDSPYIQLLRKNNVNIKDMFKGDNLSSFQNTIRKYKSKLKLIPLGTYLGLYPSHDCNKNAVKYAKSNPGVDVYSGVIISISTFYGNKWWSNGHIFNVKDGKVIEVTDLGDEGWSKGDPVYYYGVLVPKKSWTPVNKLFDFSR